MDIDLILKEIEELSGKEYLPIIGPEKGKVLIDIIEEHKPKNILEIGTLVGYSAILMAENMPEGAKITTLEIDEKSAKRAQENFEKAQMSDKIKIVLGSALETIPSLEGAFDLVFIDAEKKQYLDYLKAVEPKLSEGAVIFADNVGKFKDKMVNYLEYVRGDQNYRSKTYDFGYDAVEVSEKI